MNLYFLKKKLNTSQANRGTRIEEIVWNSYFYATIFGQRVNIPLKPVVQNNVRDNLIQLNRAIRRNGRKWYGEFQYEHNLSKEEI